VSGLDIENSSHRIEAILFAMKTIIYYYTGTGNSLWTARLIAAELGNAALYPMSLMNGDAMADAEAVGLVFPVHMWGVPSLVLDFMKKTVISG
jgi:flavodoxin